MFLRTTCVTAIVSIWTLQKADAKKFSRGWGNTDAPRRLKRGELEWVRGAIRHNMKGMREGEMGRASAGGAALRTVRSAPQGALAPGWPQSSPALGRNDQARAPNCVPLLAWSCQDGHGQSCSGSQRLPANCTPHGRLLLSSQSTKLGSHPTTKLHMIRNPIVLRVT